MEGGRVVVMRRVQCAFSEAVVALLAVVLAKGGGESTVPHHPSPTFSAFVCGILTGGGRPVGGFKHWRKGDVAC